MTTTQPPAQETAVVYPNPYSGINPAQVEIISEEAADDVVVSIFTTAFRKVGETHYGTQTAGVLKLKVEAKDKGGTPLANGLYYLVIETTQGRSVLKWIVAR